MGQEESTLQSDKSQANACDMALLDQSRNDLLHLFGMNQEVFGKLSYNSAAVAKEMLSMKSSFATRIQPFFQEDTCSIGLEGKTNFPDSPPQVRWLEASDALECVEFSNPSDFHYKASKVILEDETNLKWSETFRIFGFPTPTNLKDQIHTSLEYFCKITEKENNNEYELDIPPDTAFKLAFTLLFPNLREFCNTFVDFDNINISESQSEGCSTTVIGKNYFHEIAVCLPIETDKFKLKYPTLHYAFTGLSRLEVDVVDEQKQRKAISYVITPTSIEIHCAISGRHLVWKNCDTSQVLFQDNGDLDLFCFDVNVPMQFNVIVNPTVQVITAGPGVKLPEMHFNVEYQAQESIAADIFIPILNVTLCYVEQSNTEWVLSFVLPIVEWRNQLMETFFATMSLQPQGDGKLSTFTLHGEVSTPRFPLALKNLLGIFGTEIWIEEGLTLAYHSASAVAKDFVILFNK